MSTYVLIHPAWFGGWCWKKIVPALQEEGHAVYTPTLTGLGERAHLARPDVSLSTHIEDVVSVLVSEDLSGCDARRKQLRRQRHHRGCASRPTAHQCVVYLDAFVPGDGQSTSDLVAADRWATMERIVASEGGGWLVPRFSPTPWDPFVRQAWQVANDSDVRWMLPRLRPTPIRHFTEPVRMLPDQGEGGFRRVYVRCLQNNPAPHFDHCAATAQSSPDWTYRALDVPHLPFITHPVETMRILLELAAS